jgi:hypothetical protein
MGYRETMKIVERQRKERQREEKGREEKSIGE